MRISHCAPFFLVLAIAFLRATPARSDEVARAAEAFNGDFERGDLSDWGRETARPDSVQIVTSPTRRGRYAAKFTLRAGERVSNGNRAEMTWDNRDRPGSEVWYGWSFLIPRDFPDIEWKPKLWQCIGQWHDQPDTARGENWDTFPAHSPSIAVYYTSKGGVPSIEIWYGAYKKGEEQKIVATAPIRKGEWLDLQFHIRWSRENDGFLEAFLGGKPLVAPRGKSHRARGANMWNDAPHYLKIGLYRSSEITSTNSIYFDEVRIAGSRAKVALPRRRERR